MKELINKINKLQETKIKTLIDKRLKQFESFQKKPSKEWFSELCFCLLTANSKAETAIAIQNDLGCKGFCGYSQNKIKSTIIKNKHRFHNNKSKYIVDARCFSEIKNIIKDIIKKDKNNNNNDEKAAREFLVK
ncbi:N-glycosylase, partial [Candidatus Woesearchaeota archaeon]|nr:N-glycosylase [Candidatus Woesearchaeota archaeon]